MIRPSSHSRGMVLIIALWVTIALTGLVLTLAFSMRTEALASANRISQAEAEAAERGVEQWLLSIVDQELTTPGTIRDTSMEARQVGRCLTWVVRPDHNNAGTLAYGLMDEAGKIDLNTADPDTLLKLPGMTEDVADSIKDWRDEGDVVTGQGAESDYYMALPEPYRCKNGKYESLDELRLVKGITPELLIGYDHNQNGIIDNQEATSGNTGALFNANSDSGVGFAPFVTAYGELAMTSKDPASPSPAPVDVNSPAAANQLAARLTTSGIPATRAQEIAGKLNGNQPFLNIFDFYWKVQLTSDELPKVIGAIEARPPGGTPALAKININTAPREVLIAIGFTESDADAVIAQRQSTSVTADPTNIAWLTSIISDKNKAAALGYHPLTGKSLVYSGNIVAISPDGRAFRRARVVISASTGTARIIYRRDLTSAGWPLPTEIREAIRSGQGYEAPLSGGI